MQKRNRVIQRSGGKPSPVSQSAARGGDVLERLRQQAAGLLRPGAGQFLDLTYSDPDVFIDAMNMVTDVRRRFAALPSRLRAECQNDPRQFLRLATSARQGDELSVALLKRYGLSVTPPAAVKSPAAELAAAELGHQVDLVDEAEKPQKAGKGPK